MKKEIIKPFDLASYKNGAKVKTRDGSEVRIICTDAKHPYYPIVALVKLNGDNEYTRSYTIEGKLYHKPNDINSNDLVIAEEVEEPEFWSDDEENTVKGYYIDSQSFIRESGTNSNVWEEYRLFATEKQAKSALAMARISQIMANDIKNFGGVVTDEEWENSDWKYVIFRSNNKICTTAISYDYYFLAFHTVAQRDLFLEKYYDLVKDYLMID